MVFQIQILWFNLEEMVGKVSASPHWSGTALLHGGLLHHQRDLLVWYTVFRM